MACVALLTDAAFGYPDRLFRMIGHPVTWIGGLIARLDHGLNPAPGRSSLPDRRRRLNGVLALVLLAGLPTLLAWLLQRACLAMLPHAAGLLLLGVVAGSLPAQRSLFVHVRDVQQALEAGGLDAGRNAVARIVGRDPQNLDEAAIVRAAIESLAENFSDGVVAPLLWCAVFGLPGMVFYKAVNTADSMIGHLTPRHAAFGWASARLDDLVNLPASRLAAAWIVCAALVTRPATPRAALTAVLRDAGRHRSPNAGWPEAAMAGALGLRLAGPRSYDGHAVEDAWMGDGRPGATPLDLRRALRLYWRACTIQATMLLALAMLLYR